jgi:hypothetical protein
MAGFLARVALSGQLRAALAATADQHPRGQAGKAEKGSSQVSDIGNGDLTKCIGAPRSLFSTVGRHGALNDVW